MIKSLRYVHSLWLDVMEAGIGKFFEHYRNKTLKEFLRTNGYAFLGMDQVSLLSVTTFCVVRHHWNLWNLIINLTLLAKLIIGMDILKFLDLDFVSLILKNFVIRLDFPQRPSLVDKVILGMSMSSPPQCRTLLRKRDLLLSFKINVKIQRPKIYC